MSGAVKSGLLFALLGIFVVAGFSFIPVVGPLLCGPAGAALLGGVAGYLGVRWTVGNAGVGTGVLAGTIAGVGALIGSIAFWLIAFAMVRSMPEFEQAIEETLRQQNSGADPAEVRAILDNILPIVGPFIGFCFGLIQLVISLAFGALGGWLSARNRATQGPPVAPPPMAPPPLSPQ